MTDDANVQQPKPLQSPSSPSDAAPPSEATGSREELLEKARAFLHSPQVQHEDGIAKRRFLAEKGLTRVEIDTLLQELPVQMPLVPPRTYPQPPPSNLPNLLNGVARIVTWLAGGSATLLLIYFRFLYPKIAHTFQARHSLRTHHRDLLGKLTNSVTSLKETQATTFAVLPRPEPHKDLQYGHCNTLDELVAATEGRQDIPDFTLLRCGIADLSAPGEKATAEALFRALETKFPWLASAQGAPHETRLWQTLSTSPLFRHDGADGAPTWSYAAPAPPPLAPLPSRLDALHRALPTLDPAPTRTPRAHTMQALAGLTGYIATQTYAGFRASGFGAALSAEEEDVRREIRALKGLVLNRRTFMPHVPRPSPTPPPSIAAAS